MTDFHGSCARASFKSARIMWLKGNKKQTILFIDPKGLAHLGLDHPKLKLHKYLKTEIQKQINNPEVKLDAFIVSVTPFSTLRKMHPGQALTIEELARNRHILFQFKEEKMHNTGYVERLFEIAMQD